MNKHEFQLAVDPGGTTGLAWIIDGIFDSGQLAGGRDAFAEYFEWAQAMQLTHIICEDFIITGQTAKKTPQPDALRIIGYLELWAQVRKVPFTLQTPSQAKGFSTDAKLKALGFDSNRDDIDCTDLVGRKAWVNVDTEEYQGKKRLRVVTEFNPFACGYWPETSPPDGASKATAPIDDDTPF